MTDKKNQADLCLARLMKNITREAEKRKGQSGDGEAQNPKSNFTFSAGAKTEHPGIMSGLDSFHKKYKSNRAYLFFYTRFRSSALYRLWRQTKNRIIGDAWVYGIDDFTSYHDEAFIINACRVILRREPRLIDLDTYLTGLRAGSITKQEILCMLRYSQEGKLHSLPIKGIALRRVLNSCFKIPVIGYALHLLFLFFTLPRQQHYVRVLESSFGRKLNVLVQNQQNEIIGLRLSLQALTQKNICYRPEHVEKDQKEKNFTDESLLLDGLYASFEDRFRGSMQDIISHLKLYHPLIKNAGAGSTDRPILDAGCGRGEWLELCRENGLIAQGIDTNRVMLCRCRDKGLNVVEEDIISFLRLQAANTFGAITGFHLIEHLSFPRLVAFIDETLRILQPGGVLILETPNPRNILVASGDFYRDPTHKQPVFPDTLEFIAQQRGFSEAGAFFFDTQGKAVTLKKAHDEKFEALEDYLQVSRDYALIAYKL
ncbi:MAG: class I SAM-dependent methyltransferase [Pseudomonadota bacterium]